MKHHWMMKLWRNDLKRNWVINGAIFIFLLFSAMLISTGVLVFERMHAAMEQMMNMAKPPHFLQMHVGDINEEKVASFSAKTEMVKSMQIQKMVNIEGANIVFTGQKETNVSLEDSLLDNYFVVQNKDFDYLLNLENEVITVGQGEVGIPFSYAHQKNIQIGDVLTLWMQDKKLKLEVIHLMRDAQMGSPLAGSIRFLVSEKDFKILEDSGLKKESLIGFRLYDTKNIHRFESLYLKSSSQMPQNGVAINYFLIKLIHGIDNGLMAGVLIFAGLILILIAMLNIRFILHSTMKKEVRQIATLKAIGIADKEVYRIYRVKYTVLAGLACLIGPLGSFLLGRQWIKRMALNFGVSMNTGWTYALPFLAAIFVYFFVMILLQKTLKPIRKMSVIEGLTRGNMRNKRNQKHSDTPKLWLFSGPIQRALNFHEYRMDVKGWLLFASVFFLCSFMILIPLNLYTTMSAPGFVKYLGISSSDIQIDIQYEPELKEMILSMEEALSQDLEIEKYQKTKMLRGSIVEAGEKRKFLVQSGEYEHFPLETEQGHLPKNPGEIALSSMNQARLKLALQDIIYIDFGRGEESFRVVGIYQDVTNGGYTAKIGEHEGGEALRYGYQINLKEGVDVNQFMERWRQQYRETKILKVTEMMAQTFGNIVEVLKIVVISVFILVLSVAALISLLFVTLNLHQNKERDGILFILGFSGQELRKMYLQKVTGAASFGIVTGALMSLLLGGILIGNIFSILGFEMNHMSIIWHPIYFVLLGGIAPLLLGCLAAWLVILKRGFSHEMALREE